MLLLHIGICYKHLLCVTLVNLFNLPTNQILSYNNYTLNNIYYFLQTQYIGIQLFFIATCDNKHFINLMIGIKYISSYLAIFNILSWQVTEAHIKMVYNCYSMQTRFQTLIKFLTIFRYFINVFI